MPRIQPSSFRSLIVRYGAVLLLSCIGARSAAQTFPFTSGPIPPCDTSTFTATVSGVGWLVTPDPWNWGPFLDNVLINITTDHPQTLQISLTSPAGTTLLLSAFNGAGGQNYTNTNFTQYGWNDITTASAPFTNSYYPQGGSLNTFANQNADGVWTITVVDTACANNGPGPGGTWTPGWFNGGVGSGVFAFGFNAPPPPCFIDMGWQQTSLCPGETVDVLAYYNNMWGMGTGVMFSFWDMSTGNMVPDPTAVSGAASISVSGSDWMGCNYMGSYDVLVVPPVVLGADQVVSNCAGAGPVDLTALFTLNGWEQPVWSLNGSNISTANAVSATTPGVYQLIVYNGGTCGDTALVTLTNSAQAGLGPDQATNICAGGTTDLTTLFNTAGLSPEWYFSGALIAAPTAVSAPGVYTLIGTTIDGCTDQADVTLVVQAPPALGTDQSIDVCNNATTDLTALFNTTGLTSAWTLGGAAVPDPTVVGAAGSYQLVATAAGCSDTAIAVVNANVAPALGADAAAAICSGEVVDLTTSFNTAGLNTTWTIAGAAVADPTAVMTTGVYTLVASDAQTCSDTANVAVIVSANPVLGADQSVTECDGTVIDLTTLYATGANATEWTSNGAVVADPTAITTAGSYTLTTTNAAGCTATADVAVNLDPSPALGADVSASICSGSTLDLTQVYSTTGMNAAWTLNGAAVADPTAVSVAGDHQLVVTNAFTCTDAAIVTVVVNANPDLGVDLMYTLCPWQTVDLGAAFAVGGMNAVYTIDGQAVIDPTAVHDPGVYTVAVADANGCTDDATATVINVECMCLADFAQAAKCYQDPVQFTLVADSVILGAHWDFSGVATASADIDPIARFTSAGNVQVTLRAMLSCGEVVVERTVHLEDCSDSCSVWIPSAFTPDNDEQNDSWRWNGECKPADFSMEIFDRWGEMVYATNDPASKWDGTSGGMAAPPGVYVYRVGYQLPYQKHKEAVGSLTLLR